MEDAGNAAHESTQLLPREDDDEHRPHPSLTCSRLALGYASAVLATVGILLRPLLHRAPSPNASPDPSSPFPPGFLWGAATSAYQIEGGTTLGGRGPSIWDAWCTESPDNCNGDTGDVSDDHFHRWKEDVELMRDLGLKAYRFSISWSRILPNGTADYEGGNPADVVKDAALFGRRIKGVNYEGIEFYSRIIDLLLEYDIEPFITLYHWDLPQALQDEYGGWADRSIVDDFADYARICYHHFANRAKYWVTINEGWTVAIHGYEEGSNAPGLMGEDVGGTGKPYLVGHHLLLAHARAVQLFREEGYGAMLHPRRRRWRNDHGLIGIANCGDHRFPLDPESEDDIEAADRSIEFQLGWMTDPIWMGDYPASMRLILGDRLPQFTEDELHMLVGSADFLGINHYSSAMASKPTKPPGYGGYWAVQNVNLTADPSWNKTDMGWSVVPEGARAILLWMDERYNRPLIFVTENGMAAYEPDKDHSIHDDARKEYLEGYVRGFGQALDRGVNLGGYFAWSLLDNFEWQYGFSKRFGIVHVNYTTLERTLKSSANFYQKVIETNGAILPQ